MKRVVFTLCALMGAYTFLFAYNPPAGGESANTFFSPDLLGGQVSATGGPFGDGNPPELATNPALCKGLPLIFPMPPLSVLIKIPQAI